MISHSVILLICLILPCSLSFHFSNPHQSADYPGIGFFSLPGPFDYLPADPATIRPTFSLYTRENPTESQLLPWNDTESITSSAFNGSRPTKMIIHGFIENPVRRPWMAQMKDALLQVLDANVLLVDWSINNANWSPYGQAAANTQVVGPLIALQIRALCSVTNSTPEQFHLIGQSLGAHVAGFAGKYLNGSLGQITGMDPAGPGFTGSTPENRLWYSDAQFVDAIHTDNRPMVGLGMEEPCGTVDFYPNGARRQAGCGMERLSSFWKSGFGTGARTLFACEHYRSWAYYIEAITKYNQSEKMQRARGHRCESYETFEEGKCADCGEMEENCAWFGLRVNEFKLKDGENRVRMYFDTAESEPFFE